MSEEPLVELAVMTGPDGDWDLFKVYASDLPDAPDQEYVVREVAS